MLPDIDKSILTDLGVTTIGDQVFALSSHFIILFIYPCFEIKFIFFIFKQNFILAFFFS